MGYILYHNCAIVSSRRIQIIGSIPNHGTQLTKNGPVLTDGEQASYVKMIPTSQRVHYCEFLDPGKPSFYPVVTPIKTAIQ